MSHFTVMVLGHDPEKQLARYEEDTSHLPHEWKTFKNVEEDYRKKYETDKMHIEKIYHNYIEISPEKMNDLEAGGEVEITVTDPLDSAMINLENYEYYRLNTSAPKDHRNTIVKVVSVNKFSRENVVIKAIKTDLPEVFIKDQMSWDKFMTDYCGYEFDKELGAYGYWYNEKAKWDWYQLGGRWNGYFKLKSSDPTTGIIGDDGVFGAAREDFSGRADQTTKGNIDVEGMRAEEAEAARKKYQYVKSCFGGNIPKVDIPWSTISSDSGPYKDMDWDERRSIYHGQPALKALAETRDKIENDKKNVPEEYHGLFHFIDLEDFDCSEDEYAKRYADGSLSTFAVVKDGEWYQRGEMGWWASVTDEMDENEWNSKVMELFNSLPDDTIVSVFDCHI